MTRAVTLSPHDPAWAVRAMDEARRISAALPAVILRVEHVGSTSIPGLCAKPTIDLMPVAANLAALDKSESAFRALGYAWRGEHGMPGRRFCTQDDADGRRLFNVHCLVDGDAVIARRLAFRDYLRTHADEVAAYESVKLRAAAQCGDNQDRYTEEKGIWIDACEARAVAWSSQR